MEWQVPLSDLSYGEEEYRAALDVLESGWLTMGAVTERFERAFAECLGGRHAIAVSNATAALHVANLVLGVGPGDEVIVPSLSFVATANAVKYANATPVFADIRGEEDLCISPEAIRAKITPRTKAIVVMHYGGYMCDMPAILAIAKEHDLTVIEDAAHAPGAELNGKKAGTWGEIGCFSFFSNKNLVTGEGGMIVTDRDDLAEQMRLLRSHGMTSLTWDRHRGRAHSYDVVALGYNYRIDELRSALGLVQLEKLADNNRRRRTISEHYRSELAKLGFLSLPHSSHPGLSAAHLFPVLLDPGAERQGFIKSMHARGIQTSVHYPPIHQFSLYRQDGGSPYLPMTEQIALREVTLPLYPTLNDAQVELVIKSVDRELARVAP